MLLGRLTGDTATFREISAKHWHRPALVFNGREEDTFEINLAQLNERTAGRAHPGDRRPLILRLATGRQSREAMAAPGRSGTMNTLADCAIARHGDGVASASITLQPALTAPGQVHTFTRQSLYRWGEGEQLIEPAVRALCEPVTNAVRHGAQRLSAGRRCERIRLSLITLTLTLHPDALRAEVRDGSGILPVQRSARRDDCGRGLAIIDALAEYWTLGRAPRGGKWVRPCMSGGNGLFDGGR